MSTINLEPLLEQVERRAVLTVLRAHPEWTLGCVFKHLEQNGARAPLLRELTLGELLAEPVDLDPIPAEEPPIDRRRLEVAKRLRGARFDDVVRTVLTEAGSEPVAATYLKARVGGPRWKLQGSLRRLIDAGAVERTGTTSGTRYRARTA